jgi:hypothetical protein
MGGDFGLEIPWFRFDSVVSSRESRDTGESGSRSVVDVFVKVRSACASS